MFSRFILIVLLSLVFTVPVHAAVVINEFLPNPSGPSTEDTEWIELYNTSPDSVDLSGWKLDDIDTGGSSPYAIASGSSIAASSFLVFEKATTNIALNNDGDTVRLLNTEGSVVDSHSYGGTSEDVSIGRTTNGGGSWVTCTSPTKGSGNNCSEPTTTATNTPTKTPTQAPQATSTPTTSATSTPVPSKKLTPTKTPTPRPKADQPLADTATAAAVLGAEVSVSTGTASASGGLKQVLPLIIALLLVAIGFAIIAFVLVWKRRKLTQ